MAGSQRGLSERAKKKKENKVRGKTKAESRAEK